MKKTSAAQNPRSIMENYRVIAIACLLGTLITAVVLLVAAMVISAIDFPQSGILPVVIVASVIGCFGAGFFCGRMTKSGGLVYGLICGLVIFLLCLLCEVSFLGGELGTLALYKGIICVSSSMIGGVLGVNKRKRAH